MNKEILRWLISLCLHYLIVPALWLIAGFVYDHLFGFSFLEHLGSWRIATGIGLVSIGLYWIVTSYRDQLVYGGGHPFDLLSNKAIYRPTQRLLTNGVYSWSRNPMNFGDILFYLGLSFVANCSGGVIINGPASLLVVVLHSRLFERPGLVKRFGQEYLEYEKHTSILIPGFRTFRRLIARFNKAKYK